MEHHHAINGPINRFSSHCPCLCNILTDGILTSTTMARNVASTSQREGSGQRYAGTLAGFELLKVSPQLENDGIQHEALERPEPILTTTAVNCSVCLACPCKFPVSVSAYPMLHLIRLPI